MLTRLLLENLKEQDCLVDVLIGGRIILKFASNEWNESMWTGFIRLSVGTSDRLL
jgi:hypothetical protein